MRLGRVDAIVTRKQMERRKAQITDASHLPAVSAVDRAERFDVRELTTALVRERGECGVRASLENVYLRGEVRARGRADGRVLLLDELLGLERPGHELAVEQQPVRAELLPES